MSASYTLKLNEADTVRFIELYQNEPVLFYTTMQEYCIQDLCAAAVKCIADALNVSGCGPSEVIVKFKKLEKCLFPGFEKNGWQ